MRRILTVLLVIAGTSGGSASASYPGENGRIAFVAFDGGFDIYSVAPDGSDRERLSGPRSDYEPTWSPDGTRIAFFSDRLDAADIWTMDASDGTDRIRVTRTKRVTEFDPDWQPVT